MNPQGFSFPPPPPPPPTQQPQPHQQHYPNNATFPPYGQGHHGQRGGRGGGSGHFRGRGRGYGNRGGTRGGHFMAPDANRPGAYPTATPVGYNPISYSNFANQPQQGIPTSHFTPPQPPSNYQSPQTPASFATPRPYSQGPPVPRPSYTPQSSYDPSYTGSTAQPPPPYQQVVTSHHQHVAQPVQPAMMGPPIRWGFESAGPSGSYNVSQRGHQRGPRPHNTYNHQTSPERLAKHVNKRDHSSAFGKSQSFSPRTPAPPPVPSFGNPLPSKPPAPADASRKPKKKKRKHNQLGLTPKTEEHESSEEEDDVDEELRLASGDGVAAVAGAPLQVTYRGQTSKLQTPAEIAAWIQERKKRFPTQAKVEEKKKAMEQAKKAREEAQRQKQTVKHEKKGQEKHGSKGHTGSPTDPLDAAAKAKRKADKLRRKLVREEKRLAQAEADAERARIKAGEQPQNEIKDVNKESTSTTTEPPLPLIHSANATPASPSRDATSGLVAETAGEAQVLSVSLVGTGGAGPPQTEGDQVALDASSDLSDSSDWTSSSGSDISSSDSEDSDNESLPEQASSRRDGPERVPPPPREQKKKVCRHFARNGRCLRGDKCKFLHEAPDRGPKTKAVEKKGRKGLFQALLDRQKQDEDRRAMEVIVWLGENGFLDETNSKGEGCGDASVVDGVSSHQEANAK